MIVGGGWIVCLVAEIIAQRKISADVICVPEERLGEYSVPWLDHRICYSGFPAVNRATFCVVAGRPDGASHHLGQIEGASGALVYPGRVEDEILCCVNWSVALHP